MKTVRVALAAGLASVAVAQLGTLPSCATTCLTQYVNGGSIAGCNSLDIKCICSNSSFLSGIACCLAASCSPADQQAAVTYADSLCATNGVTNLPPSVSCDSTASTASTAAPSSSGSSAAASAAPSTASAATTPAAATTGSSTSASGSGSSTSPSVTAAASSSAGSSSSAAPKSSSGAGAQNIAAMGAGLAGGLAAVAAFL